MNITLKIIFKILSNTYFKWLLICITLFGLIYNLQHIINYSWTYPNESFIDSCLKSGGIPEEGFKDGEFGKLRKITVYQDGYELNVYCDISLFSQYYINNIFPILDEYVFNAYEFIRAHIFQTRNYIDNRLNLIGIEGFKKLFNDLAEITGFCWLVLFPYWYLRLYVSYKKDESEEYYKIYKNLRIFSSMFSRQSKRTKN
jgi:hypothetical protein